MTFLDQVREYLEQFKPKPIAKRQDPIIWPKKIDLPLNFEPELARRLLIAVEALEFYVSPHCIAFNIKTKEIFELKQMMPGVVWNCDHPTEATAPIKFGSCSEQALAQITAPMEGRNEEY